MLTPDWDLDLLGGPYSLEVRTNLEPSMVSQIPPTFIDILMTSFLNMILIG